MEFVRNADANIICQEFLNGKRKTKNDTTPTKESTKKMRLHWYDFDRGHFSIGITSSIVFLITEDKGLVSTRCITLDLGFSRIILQFRCKPVVSVTI